MFSPELFNKLDPNEQIKLRAFLLSDFFQSVADSHINMYGLKLTVLDVNDPNFKTDYFINQSNLQSWRQLLMFINSLREIGVN